MKKSYFLLIYPILILVFAFSVNAFVLDLLTDPTDAIITSTTSLNATFNVTMHNNSAILNCSLWTNQSGTWELTQANGTGNVVSNASTSWINYTLTLDNESLWGIECYDEFSLRNVTSNRTYTLDTTNPAIINSTGNYLNASIQQDNDWIYFNVTNTDTNWANITFYLHNWTPTEYNSTVYTGSLNTSINWTGLPYGRWFFNATLTDSAGNTNSTGTYEVFLFKIESTFNTTLSTNFSDVVNWTSMNLTLASNSVNVTWSDNQDLSSSSLDFDTYVTFGTESLFVEQNLINVTGRATIYMSGLTYTQTPSIKRDSEHCGVCENVVYSNGILTFETTGFSTYTLTSNDGSGGSGSGGGGGGVGSQGNGYCGNGICDSTYIGEDENNCPDDCKAKPYGATPLYQTGSVSTVDTDGDGITDYQETYIYFTNPEKIDSDGDGISDNIEVKKGTTPGKVTTTNQVNQVGDVIETTTKPGWIMWLSLTVVIIAVIIIVIKRNKKRKF